ncbi:hypothetical protein ARMSODRAFT_1028485 [Armillaria solidipes]|uniref:Uncharacterized protein n=1 Tax=Armillaria solidipes TaxID=1076256 RepID=A0A2H3B0L5_9AGAR|nr:hypothetical protein ARMSODRAFT_1028485 [Armillaria solidipes]
MHKKNSKPSSSPSKVTPAKRDANTPPPVENESKRPKANTSSSKSSSDVTLSDSDKPNALLDNTDKSSLHPTGEDDCAKTEVSHPLNNLTKAVHGGSLAEHGDKSGHPTPVIEADNVVAPNLASGSEVNVAPSPVIEPSNKDTKIERTRSPTPVIKPNLTSFFHSFMASKPVMVLPRVHELGISYGDPTPYPITPFILADHVGGNENKAERILKYALAAEGTNLFNLFSVQPRNFRYTVVNKSNDGRKIVRASDNLDASFYMVGRVTHCSLENGEYNKEIDIQPLGRLLPRCVAVIAQILRFQQPVFSVYKDGLTISSYRKPMEGQKEPKIKPIAMNGETHGPSIRAWNQEAKSPCFPVAQNSL